MTLQLRVIKFARGALFAALAALDKIEARVREQQG